MRHVELERASLLDPSQFDTWPADGVSRVAYGTLASLASGHSLDADRMDRQTLARWADDGGRWVA